ncbi:MAG: succinate-semialdehyde dehydrogenase (NADP(+)) [Rickettsiales bacterium]|nr:succinate-semialdehyde dehydrogenase (NADP(+)) [Rickettsiales bacterium]
MNFDVKNKTLLQNGAFINGKWVDLKEKFKVINPANGEFLGDVSNCSVEHANQAIEAADKAFQSWKNTLAEKRRELLLKWANLIEENLDDLATILTTEQGKPLNEAKGELSAGANTTAWMAEEARRIDGSVVPTMNEDHRYLVIKQPVGVCAAITPWNFPASMITRKISPALAAGCTIILKPSEETPFIAFALIELARQAGFPDGVINILPTDDASSLGKVLCDSETVRKLSFTGSTAVGKTLYTQCGDTVKNISLELGGNAPFIVFDDADLETAVQNAIICKFRNAGQTCICANRIFVQDGIYDDFMERFKVEVEKIKLGNGLDENTKMGPLINKKGHDKVKDLADDAVKNGACLITGGKTHEAGERFYTPTILTDLDPSMKIFKNEIFGPVAAIYRFNDEKEVIKMANDTNYGLAGYIQTQDLGRAFRVSEGIEYGMVGVNVPSTSNSATPFGGVKHSGVGREGSHWGIEEYVENKFVLMGGIGK